MQNPPNLCLSLFLVACFALPVFKHPLLAFEPQHLPKTEKLPEVAESPLVASPYIEIQKGSLPVVVCAPHGGRQKPDDIPDRTRGTFAFDTNTQELSRAIAAVFRERTREPLGLIICKLHRTKLDCNREEEEGAAGQAAALNGWNAYHGAIGEALKTAVNRHGAAVLIDIHGHGHKTQNLELGYAHDLKTLGLGDKELNGGLVFKQGSLASIAQRSQHSYADLLHGEFSLGTLMHRAGFPAVPSSTATVPPIPYFDGGYTIRRHSKSIDGAAAIQIETHYRGVRDSPENQMRFANALFQTLQVYLKTHLQIDLPIPPP